MAVLNYVAEQIAQFDETRNRRTRIAGVFHTVYLHIKHGNYSLTTYESERVIERWEKLSEIVEE